jgi:hypothetical protein
MTRQKVAEPFALGGLLGKKVKILQKFLQVTDSLYHTLAVRDMTEVGRVLEQRQDLIHSIDEIDIKIIELQFENSPGGKNLSNPVKDPLRSIREEVKDLLRQVADLDKKSLGQAEFLRDEILKEWSAARQGWIAARQYAQRGGFQPRFMDLRQ